MIDHPELYILRHGETTWNQNGRFQGQKDSPLTEKGQAQAREQKAILNALSRIPNSVRVSPLGRARQTAQIALGADKEIIVDNRLTEIDFGIWEGLSKEQIKTQIDYSFEDGSWNFRSPEGETFDMISERVTAFLSDLTEPTIIVTHGTTSIVMRGLCIGLDQAGMLRLSKDQGCIYHLSDGEETILR